LGEVDKRKSPPPEETVEIDRGRKVRLAKEEHKGFWNEKLQERLQVEDPSKCNTRGRGEWADLAGEDRKAHLELPVREKSERRLRRELS